MLVEKYRPKNLHEMVMGDQLRDMLAGKISAGQMDNILLHGRQGIGKSSLAKAIVAEMEAPCLYINAGYESNLDTIRCKVKEFCDTRSITGGLKLVIIDEADSLSSAFSTGSNAQSALRNIIEESADDTRFILTCNYLDKIIPPLQSRCFPISINFAVKDVVKRVLTILQMEKVKYDVQDIKWFTDLYVTKLFPDIRMILNALDKCITTDGKFIREEALVLSVDEPADVIYNMIKNNADPQDIRKWYYSNEVKFSNDYIALSSGLFNKYNNPQAQIQMAEYIYKMSVCLDKEIQFYSMILGLCLNEG